MSHPVRFEHRHHNVKISLCLLLNEHINMSPIIIAITSQLFSISRYNKMKRNILKYNSKIYLANIVLIAEWFLILPEIILQYFPVAQFIVNKVFLDFYCIFLCKGFVLTNLRIANRRPVSSKWVARAHSQSFGPVRTRCLNQDSH